MLTTAPLNRLLVERGLNISMLSQLTRISESTFLMMNEGKRITPRNINAICSILKCQPCDVIEFKKTETKGHWEWISQ